MDTTRVVPVVVFLRANRQADSLTLGNEFFDYLQFRYIRATLAEMPAEHYLESDNLVARLNLPNMHWPAELKLAIYASAIRGLTSLEQNPDKQVKYLEFIDIYAQLDNNEQAQFKRLYQQEGNEMKGFIERYTEQGIEKGIEQGIEQGIKQGKLEGRASTLQKQLQLKFGPLPQELEQRLFHAGEAELDVWTERVLFAESLQAVFA